MAKNGDITRSRSYLRWPVRGVLMLTVATAAVGFVTYLLIGHYRSAVERCDSILRTHSMQTEDMAAAIGHFCAERRYEVTDLALNRAIASYYENEALGMRPEYGLRASLTDVAAEFRRLIDRRSRNGHPIYKQIAYVDHRSGILVAEGEDRTAVALNSTAATAETDEVRIFTAGHDSKERITAVAISSPVLFKGRHVGRIVAIIPAVAILDRLQHDRNGGSVVHVMLGERPLHSARADEDHAPVYHLAPLLRLPIPSGKAIRTEIVREDGRKNTLVVVARSPVADTSVAVFHLAEWRPLVGGMTPEESLILLAAMAFALLGAAGITIRSIVRGIAMATRLEEQTRRQDELFRSNQQLVEEIAQRRRAEERLEYDATHDALTGLPNRSLFVARLAAAVERSRGDPAFVFAVLFLDFDRFKLINDSLGHHMGDRFLCECAMRLGKWAAAQSDDGMESDVARLGGDEFVVHLKGVNDPAALPAKVEQLRELLAQPYLLEDREVFATASIGMTVGNPGDGDADQVLRDADIALYRAKARGRDCHVTYDQAMHEEVRMSLDLVNDLRRAVERKQLQLHYQPIVSLHTCELKGFEALLRWEHPVYGWISPVKFIPLAEDTGLIVSIGDWVLQEAARQLNEWRHTISRANDIYVSVNVSKRQLLQRDFPERVAATLAQYELPLKSLKIEVTESVVLEATELFREVLDRLKMIGVDLMMDDFGTGNSSLSRLHEFPIDILKIDRAFLQTMTTSRQLMAITTAVVQLAHNLDLQIVCEGVEDEDQVAVLLALDCDSAQGYLFSKPLPVAKATECLRNWRVYRRSA